MKYMLLLIRSDDVWEALGDAERDYEAIGRWWAQHAQNGRVVAGHELQPARTATTVRWENHRPVVRLNRTSALRYVAGTTCALAEVEALEGNLQRYHLYHATRADFLQDLGREEEARDAVQTALCLAANPAERALLLKRLDSA